MIRSPLFVAVWVLLSAPLAQASAGTTQANQADVMPAIVPDSVSTSQAATTSVSRLFALDYSDDAPKWRLDLVAAMVPQYLANRYGEFGPGAGYVNTTNPGEALGISYFSQPWLGFNAYVGFYHDYDNVLEVMAIGEMELLPVRLSIGSAPDVFELGVVAGLNSIIETRPGSWSFLHVGARANLNVTPRLGLTSAIRYAPYLLGYEAGVMIRL